MVSLDVTLHSLPNFTDSSAVFVNNHTGVWGSWYDVGTGEWGYACCHSTIHISYCTGEAGIEAARASSAQHLLASAPSAQVQEEQREEVPPAKDPSALEDRRKKADELFSKRRLGEGDLKMDESRLAQAIKEERKRKAKGEDDEWGKKRKKAETSEVTEEELGVCDCFYSFTLFF